MTPAPERSQTLGVLGGMGPAATAEFMRELSDVWPAHRDQDHPRVIVLSEPGIPDRGEALLAGGEDPTPRLRRAMLTLCSWGATVLAVPCNTATVFIRRFGAELPVPVIDMVSATLAEAESRAPQGAWLLATEGTIASGIYQQAAADLGYCLLIPDEPQRRAVQLAIRGVKSGRLPAAAATITAVTSALWERRDVPVIAACTEVPLAYERGGCPPQRVVSSTHALAVACRSWLGC